MTSPFQPIPCGADAAPPTPCCSPAIASTGLCLSDGTPIAVLAVSACVDCGGPATAPAVSGWVNLLTGAFTAGNPPAGTVVCDPQQQFQVGQWCDLDANGDVIAPVLVEYEYDDDGALVGVRTLTPAGAPYVVVGTLGLCPGPVADVEYKILCDVLADGSVTRFLRAYSPNGDGTSTYSDTDFEGVAYAVQGTPGACPDCETTQVCVRPSGRVEFISNAANATDNSVDLDWQWSTSPTGPTWFDMYRVPIYPGWGTVDGGTPQGTAHWVAPHPGGGPANTGLPNEGPAVPADWYAHASFTLPANADPATILISSTVLNADQLAVEWRLNGGAWQPVNRSHAQPPYVLPPTSVPGAQAGVNEIVLHVNETVLGQPAAGLMVHMIAEYDVDASGFVTWTRVACDDGTEYYLDDAGVRQSTLPVGWAVVPCPSESCAGCESMILCDSTPAPAELVMTTTDPAPYYNIAVAQDELPFDQVDVVWAGGSTVVPASAVQGLHTFAAGVVGFEACPCGEAGDVEITGSIRFRNDGPTAAEAAWGRFALWQDGVIVSGGLLGNPMPVGAVHTAAIGPVTVDLAKVLAGDVVVEWNVEANGDTNTPKAWTVDQFAITAVVSAPGCGHQFIRTLCRDCDGAITTVTDTELDAVTAYTPVGEVATCQPAAPCGGTGAGAVRLDRHHGEFILCDDNGPFVRKLIQDGDGVVERVVDLTLAGVAYMPAGTVRACSDCRQIITSELCDGVPGGLNAYGSTTTAAPVVLGPGDPVFGNFFSVAPQPLFDGGSVAVPQWGTSPGSPRYQSFQGAITPVDPTPCGPPTMVVVTVAMDWTKVSGNEGDTGSNDVLVALRNGTTTLDAYSAPSGNTGTVRHAVVSATVAWADLVAGNINVMGRGKVWQPSVRKGYSVNGYTVTVVDAAPVPGCSAAAPVPFLRHRVVDCNTGALVSTFDTTPAGDPYTVGGVVAACVVEAVVCLHCDTITLCDDGADDPATITGTASGTGTLSNGVTYAGRGSAGVQSGGLYDGGAGEGTWWPAVYGFPNVEIGPATWTFNRPSYVEFSVYMRYYPFTPADGNVSNPNPRNETQLPANVEPVSLPDGYHYDPVTHVLSVDVSRGPVGGEPCTNLTAPIIAESARFRTIEPVSSVVTRYRGVRVANCGVFGTQRVGAFVVDPTGQFLRTLCRDCDGAVVSVTDTALDGQTPYTVVGSVKTCPQTVTGSVSLDGPVEVACVHAETVELCDSAPTPLRLVAAAFTPTTTYKNMAGARGHVALGTAQTVFDGGVGTVPASLLFGEHQFAVGRVSFAGGCAPCGVDDAQVAISGTLRFRNDGPTAAEAIWGRFSLWNGPANITPGDGLLTGGLPVGGVFTATFGPLTVPAADIAAGLVVVEWNVEVNGETNTPKAWTVDAFALTATTSAPGCGETFLRTIVRDCAGEVVDTLDTLDGAAAYVPVGVVAPCRGPGCGGGEDQTAGAGLSATISAHDGVAAGSTVVPPGARSITLSVQQGTVDVLIGAGPAVSVPAGTYTWAVDGPGEALFDAYAFSGGVGEIWTVHTTREV